ncbi:zf-TFIIB domain-containing protein [Candidatus Uabimicrobium sp. HlEnr_7]|uniref:zf-TFIIB domain-containing protein n=1 Tax=Candidatus Uabimicrobium helgolandensis TaxID=3095367 RepID=UPI003556D939
MDCPRCNLAMIPTKYENKNVLCCQSCWGYWLSTNQLDSILHTLVYKFDENEKQKILHDLSKGNLAVPANKDGKIKCPQCQGVMIKKPYSSSCPIIVDECSLHGVWLDTGELKALQIYVEQQIGKVNAKSDLALQIDSIDRRLAVVEQKLDYLINFIRKVRGDG